MTKDAPDPDLITITYCTPTARPEKPENKK